MVTQNKKKSKNNEENVDGKKSISMDIRFDSSIDRKNHKIADDKQKIEELGFSCNIKQTLK